MIEFNKLNDFLNLLVLENRKIILPLFRKITNVETKTDLSPVTEADKSTEKNIRSLIHKNFPDDEIRGEEFPDKITGSNYNWIIDPIDGTRSFITGKPTFGTLVGLYDRNKPIAGLIDIPVLEETYIGVKGYGAYLNGNKIKTKNTRSIHSASIACTSPNMFNEKQLKLFKNVENKCINSVWGGDCHNFALLSAGFIDIVIEHNLSWHDIAATIPIIEEAGGLVTDWNGVRIDSESDGGIIASSNKYLHKEVLDIIGN